jgi:hypothetical protein
MGRVAFDSNFGFKLHLLVVDQNCFPKRRSVRRAPLSANVPHLPPQGWVLVCSPSFLSASVPESLALLTALTLSASGRLAAGAACRVHAGPRHPKGASAGRSTAKPRRRRARPPAPGLDGAGVFQCLAAAWLNRGPGPRPLRLPRSPRPPSDTARAPGPLSGPSPGRAPAAGSVRSQQRVGRRGPGGSGAFGALSGRHIGVCRAQQGSHVLGVARWQMQILG